MEPYDIASLSHTGVPEPFVERRVVFIQRTTTSSPLGLSVVTSTNGNVVFVTEVEPGSPSQLGGLLVGDIITSLNGHSIESVGHFHELMSKIKSGKSTFTEIGIENKRLVSNKQVYSRTSLTKMMSFHTKNLLRTESFRDSMSRRDSKR